MVFFGGFFNMFGILYIITNKINGKRYVGQTIQTLQKRWIAHCCNSNPSSLIGKSINKRGKENFDIRILSICNSLEEMNSREIYYIKLFNTLNPNGYNLAPGGRNSITSKETSVKQSNSAKGRIVSLQTRERISISNKGKKRSLDAIRKTAEKNIGRKASNETKVRLSESHMGYKMPESQKNNISKHNKGKKRTVDHKKKYSNSKNHLKIKVFCPEIDMVFESIGAAAEYTGAWRTNIGKVLSGELRKTKGLTFSRIT